MIQTIQFQTCSEFSRGLIPCKFVRSDLPSCLKYTYKDNDYPVLAQTAAMAAMVSVPVYMLLFHAHRLGRFLSFLSSGSTASVAVLFLCFGIVFMVSIAAKTGFRELQTALDFRKGNYEIAAACLTRIHRQNHLVTRFDNAGRPYQVYEQQLLYYFGMEGVMLRKDNGSREGDIFLLFFCREQAVACLNIQDMLYDARVRTNCLTECSDRFRESMTEALLTASSFRQYPQIQQQWF